MMRRTVLFASIGAVIEMATCVALRASTEVAPPPLTWSELRSIGSSPTSAYPVSSTSSTTSSSSVTSPSITPRAPSTAPSAGPSTRVASVEEATRREWARLASVDGAVCREKLAASGVQFSALTDQRAPDDRGCGIPHGVLVQRGPTGIAYIPPLHIDCSLALEIPAIERAVQQQAETHLGSAIRRITTFGTYSCRNVRGALPGKLSEHALGNAIDIGAFTPQQGPAISVARDYRPSDDSPSARGLFLRALFRAFRSDASLTNVIGPETRADHQDHIHVDCAEPWWRGRPSGV